MSWQDQEPQNYVDMIRGSESLLQFSVFFNNTMAHRLNMKNLASFFNNPSSTPSTTEVVTPFLNDLCVPFLSIFKGAIIISYE